MTVAAQSQPDLQNDFRLRAVWAQPALVPLAIIVFITSKDGAPFMYQGLTNWWAPVLLGWTALSAVVATLALCSHIHGTPYRELCSSSIDDWRRVYANTPAYAYDGLARRRYREYLF